MCVSYVYFIIYRYMYNCSQIYVSCLPRCGTLFPACLFIAGTIVSKTNTNANSVLKQSGPEETPSYTLESYNVVIRRAPNGGRQRDAREVP